MKKILELLFKLLLFSIFVFCFIKLLGWRSDNQKTKEVLNDIEEKVSIEEEDNLDSIKEQDETTISESDPYWEFINKPFLKVNFSKLSLENEDIFGWIEVPNTNINYPVTKTTNNEYYLTHDLYKRANGGGWVFLDYRNKIDFSNKNSIIYAHGRENKTMFGTLRNILNKEWYENKENYMIRTNTKDNAQIWQVFSVYKILNTNDYIKTNFQSEEEYQSFLNFIKNRSIYDFQTGIFKDNKILTLSTCYDDYSKVVLHAKLIKSN